MSTSTQARMLGPEDVKRSVAVRTPPPPAIPARLWILTELYLRAYWRVYLGTALWVCLTWLLIVAS